MPHPNFQTARNKAGCKSQPSLRKFNSTRVIAGVGFGVIGIEVVAWVVSWCLQPCWQSESALRHFTNCVRPSRTGNCCLYNRSICSSQSSPSREQRLFILFTYFIKAHNFKGGVRKQSRHSSQESDNFHCYSVYIHDLFQLETILRIISSSTC